MKRQSWAIDVRDLVLALLAIALVTVGFGRLEVTNPTIVALTYLLVVLLVAALSVLWVAIVSSVVAVLLLNYCFMPPVRTFTIVDPENRVALLVLLVVSLVASNLSSSVRARAREAIARRDELSRLFQKAEVEHQSVSRRCSRWPSTPARRSPCSCCWTGRSMPAIPIADSRRCGRWRGELVHETHVRPTAENRVQVHLFEFNATRSGIGALARNVELAPPADKRTARAPNRRQSTSQRAT